jgi:hypothetical protein
MEGIPGYKQDETRGEIPGGVLSTLQLYQLPAIDPLYLYLVPLPFYLQSFQF